MPTAYDNETYLQALQAARADIQRNVQNTINEINRQESDAIGRTGQIGGAVAAATDKATGLHDAGINKATSGLEALGLGGIAKVTGARTAAAADENRVNQLGTQESFRRAADLLASGFRERAVGQRSSANQIATDLYGQNDRERASYITRRQQEDRQAELMRAQIAQQAQMQRESLAAQAEQARLANSSAIDGAQIRAMQAVLLDPTNAGKTRTLVTQWARQRGVPVEVLAGQLGFPPEAVASWPQAPGRRPASRPTGRGGRAGGHYLE